MVLFAGVFSSAEMMKFFGASLCSDNQDVSFVEEKNVCKNGRNPCGFWAFLPVKLRETTAYIANLTCIVVKLHVFSCQSYRVMWQNRVCYDGELAE